MDQSRLFFWTVAIYSFFLCSPRFGNAQHRGAPKVESQQTNGGFTDQKPAGADSPPHRKRRYLTFNNDQSNIRVEMVFAVPVLAIPIGGKDSSDEVPTFPTIDINTKSILATGVIMFMLFFIIPTLVRLYFPMPSSDSSSGGHGRSYTRSGREDIFQLLSRFEETMKNFNIDSGQCSQKVVCWMVSNAANRVSASKATSFDKIIDGISSFSWVQYMLEDSPYGEALSLGQNRDCDYYNNKCSITSNKLTVAANSLLNAIKKSKREESARNPSP
ncbi:unnamed protein product [Bemisia tabaci]|uniref:Uncharacterized protein n=1 Tax=Bemisia tabaci TaxID=7038 RepID=A0A9P0AJ10_BEMTA|nr:unnamed protein product [Bemisia tabaci]